jgi:hypothetical protein
LRKHLNPEAIWLFGSHARGDDGPDSDLDFLAAEPPALDVAVYHCQQAAEKAIKSWLLWKEVPFPKTHDLNRLLGLCAPLEPEFENLRPHAAFLNPFAARIPLSRRRFRTRPRSRVRRVAPRR